MTTLKTRLTTRLTTRLITRAAAVAATLVAIAAAGNAHALAFNFSFTPDTDERSRQAVIAAGNHWSSVISDNLTLNLTIAAGRPLEAGVLGTARPLYVGMFYSDFRTRLASRASSSADQSALASMPSTFAFDRLINRTADNPAGPGSATPYLDPTTLGVRLTAANARAIGLQIGGSTSLGCITACDAIIRLSTSFAWDYDPSDGIDSDRWDFTGVAVHEIGHALGFFSGVDAVDSAPGLGLGSYNTVNSLDFFRYSAESTALGAIDFTADARDKYFSLDGGATVGPSFATGQRFGDGFSTSHWRNGDGTGVMGPLLLAGQSSATLSDADLLAMDVIGWTMAAPVPEPATTALFGVGLAGLLLARRRQRLR